MRTEEDGVIRRTGQGYEIVFVRRLSKSIDKVWAALTVPERIADWLAAATVEPDLRVGARFNLRFSEGDYRMAGEIVALEPPRLIAWTWPDPVDQPDPAVVRFELAPDGDGCVLTLTNSGAGLPHPSQMAGWHTHLEGLEGAAGGVQTPWSAEREKVHQQRYASALAAL
ncbi:MAG TPA: SRPBCC family protein [Caulobacteraceae bacterium]|jgi:uncharacterized protein YndB with AHSA1/START domain